VKPWLLLDLVIDLIQSKMKVENDLYEILLNINFISTVLSIPPNIDL